MISNIDIAKYGNLVDLIVDPLTQIPFKALYSKPVEYLEVKLS